jgi:hypothetical protein
MAISYRQRLRPATAILDLDDRWALRRGIHGRHPRPFGAIRYSLVAREVGGVRQPLADPMRLVMIRNPSGYDLFFGQVWFNDHDRVSRPTDFPGRPPGRRDSPSNGSEPGLLRADLQGTYILRIESDYYQTAEQPIALPSSETPYSIGLEPGYRYPFPDPFTAHGGAPTLLRGTLYATGGAALPRVRVEVPDRSLSYVTNDSGQWVLVFPDDEPSSVVTVRIGWPDGRSEQVPAVAIEQGRSRTLVQAGLRGWVHDAAGLPVRGARVSVSGHAGEALTGVDGSWYFYFGLSQPVAIATVTAVLPDGRALTRPNVQVQPRALVVVPTFRP